MIRWHCPTCQNVLEAFDDSAGLKIACGNCGAMVEVPEQDGNRLDDNEDRKEPSNDQNEILRPTDVIPTLPLISLCLAVIAALFSFVPYLCCLSVPIFGVGFVITLIAASQPRGRKQVLWAMMIWAFIVVYALAVRFFR